jgi:hypothetical protein
MAIGYCEARYIHFRQQQNIEDSHDVHNRKLRELCQELGNFNLAFDSRRLTKTDIHYNNKIIRECAKTV